MSKKLILIPAFFAAAVTLGAQELYPLSYAGQPLLLNPAFAGTTRGMDISPFFGMNYYGPKGGQQVFKPVSSLTCDYYFKKIRSGIGLAQYSDWSNSSWNRDYFSKTGLSYSFYIPLKKDEKGVTKLFLQPGLGLSCVYRSWTNWGLMVEDFAPSNYGTRSAQYLDLSSGILLCSKNGMFGFCSHYLNRPDLAPLLYNHREQVSFSINGSYIIRFEQSKRNFFIEPHFAITDFSRVDGDLLGGVNVNYGCIYLGTSYDASYGALVFNAGAHFKKIRLEYSFEHDLWGRGSAYDSGSHNLLAHVYLFGKKTKDIPSTRDFL